MTKKTKTFLISFLSLCILIGLDQLTKHLASIHLKTSPKVLINNVFQLHYLENRGAAFGMMQGKKYVFIIATVLILSALIYLYIKMPLTRKYTPMRLTSVVLAAGAVGNMIDRVFRHYVIDFFYFELIDFPIFNVADCYVVIAAIFFVILILFYYKDEDYEFLMKDKD